MSLRVLSLAGTVLSVALAACSGPGAARNTPAPTPDPADTARLSPRILTEQAPTTDTARLRPNILPMPSQPSASPSLAREALNRRLDSTFAAPMWRSAQWGVLIVDPDRGDTIYSHNAGKLFVPASNTKIVTGAVALAQLGGDYRYTTRVLGRSPRRDGVMPGDLVVVGSGDPSFSDALADDAMAPLRALADSLHARGIRRIEGRLLSGANVFPDSPLGAGWAWDDLDADFAAPVDELFFNEGFARITVYGATTPGAPVRVRTTPAARVPRVDASAVTTARNCCMERSTVRVEGDVRGSRPVVRLTGAVRAGDSVVVTTALRHANAAFLDAFAEALAARGITVARGVEADAIADTTGLRTLATRISPPLSNILVAFEKPSQNQIGEVLIKTLGRERSGVGSADSGLAVVHRQLRSWGVDSSAAVMRDGGGLSRHNFITPEALVRVLHAMRGREDFDLFFDALPSAGVDGTIRNRMRDGAATANARAKTGTLDKVRNLSGYVTTADGRQLIFSILVNNHTVPTALVERIQDSIVTSIAMLDLAQR